MTFLTALSNRLSDDLGADVSLSLMASQAGPVVCANTALDLAKADLNGVTNPVRIDGDCWTVGLDGPFETTTQDPAPVTGTLNLEYISANPFGPLNEQDFETGYQGRALAKVFEHLGWDVTREYYLNDQGQQSEALVRALQSDSIAMEDALLTRFLANIRKNVFATFGVNVFAAPEADWFEAVRNHVAVTCANLVQSKLAGLDIQFDVFRRESEVMTPARGQAVLDRLKAKDLLTTGEGESLSLRTQQLGDSQDRVLRTKDGRWTYLFGDACYHADKLDRGFDGLAIVLRPDHAHYVTPLRHIIAALSDKPDLFVATSSGTHDILLPVSAQPMSAQQLAQVWPDALQHTAQTLDLTVLRSFQTAHNIADLPQIRSTLTAILD